MSLLQNRLVPAHGAHIVWTALLLVWTVQIISARAQQHLLPSAEHQPVLYKFTKWFTSYQLFAAGGQTGTPETRDRLFHTTYKMPLDLGSVWSFEASVLQPVGVGASRKMQQELLSCLFSREQVKTAERWWEDHLFLFPYGCTAKCYSSQRCWIFSFD